MNQKLLISLFAGSLVVGELGGCSRQHSRENSDLQPQGVDEKQPPLSTKTAPPPADAKTGTDSTGRPSDSSGGTTESDRPPVSK